MKRRHRELLRRIEAESLPEQVAWVVAKAMAQQPTAKEATDAMCAAARVGIDVPTLTNPNASRSM